MKVTITGENKVMGLFEKYEGVDYDMVTIKETNKRNGAKVLDVRIENGGKRAKVISSGCYKEITIQDEETGRFLLKYSR